MLGKRHTSTCRMTAAVRLGALAAIVGMATLHYQASLAHQAADACACLSAAMRCRRETPRARGVSRPPSMHRPTFASRLAFGEVLRDLVDDVGLALRLQTQRASRARTSPCQSRMFGSRDPAHGLDERLPGLDLRREHAVTVRRELVEPAPPLAGLLDPGALDPATLLEPIEQRIQRIDVEREQPAGADGRTC